MNDSGSTERYERILVGDSHTFRSEITKEMVDTFANLCGDYNPVHMDDEYCTRHGLGKRIVHGMLVLSLVSTLIGMYLPGEGAVWLSQSFDFVTPARIGEALSVTGKVTGKRNSNLLGLNLIDLKVEIRNDENRLIARGKATVKV